MGIRRSDLRTFVIALIAVAVGTSAPAIAHGVNHALFAHDSDKVDGIHAVDAAAANKDNKLVATNGSGKFPVSVIPKANADKLDGFDSTAFAGANHGHSGGDITSGTVDESFIDSDIARDSEITGGNTYSAGNGLDLTGNVFSIDTTETQARVATACSAGQFMRSIGQNGSVVCGTDENAGGDITAVTAGSGLSGGGTSGAVSLSTNFTSGGGENGIASTVARGDHHHDSRYINASPGSPESASININGRLKTTELLETGSGTGTTQPPTRTGIVIRRLNSTSTTAGHLVVKATGDSGEVHLQRDGTDGGFILNGGSNNIYSAACTGVGSGVTPHVAYLGDVVGTHQLWNDSAGLVYFTCSFGSPTDGSHETVVHLHRSTSADQSVEWVGYVLSTLNQ